MLNKYLLRRNFKSIYVNEDFTVCGHLAFKTRNVDWVDTTLPSIVLISVHTAFHEGINGHLKMEALLSTIRQNVKGKVCILIADVAHLHTASLIQVDDPMNYCVKSAKQLASRFHAHFDGYDLLYWSSLIMKDDHYIALKNYFYSLAQTDVEFRALLLADAEAAYTAKRKEEFPNKALFLEKMGDDLIEQCIGMRVLAKNGYRYLFYPGAPCASTEYINQSALQWIDVFLSIERKTESANVLDCAKLA